jgi:hypothetical protein
MDDQIISEVTRSNDEISQLKTIVEQLEICCNFINDKSITKHRISLVLLDNISEIILQRLCSQAIEYDDFIKWVMPQKYSEEKKKRIRQYFDKKIKVIIKENKISKQITDIISIGHKYRNAICHQDKYNPAIIGSIAKVLFVAVSDLFAKTRCGIRASVIGGYSESFEWLVPYGIQETHIDFPQVSKIISGALKNKIHFDSANLITVFRSDLENRIKNIRHIIDKELPWKTSGEINHILKWFEFQEKHPDLEDKLSMEYREYIYKIAKKEPVDIELAQLKQIEEKFQKEYHARIDKYRQNISYSTITKIENNINKMGEENSSAKILGQYYIFDEYLSKLENYIELATREWDRMVQREIDIRRGK